MESVKKSNQKEEEEEAESGGRKREKEEDKETQNMSFTCIKLDRCHKVFFFRFNSDWRNVKNYRQVPFTLRPDVALIVTFFNTR